jgi:hypothetical protein
MLRSAYGMIDWSLKMDRYAVPKRPLTNHQSTPRRIAEARKSLARWTHTFGEVRGRRPAKNSEAVKLTFRPQIEKLVFLRR